MSTAETALAPSPADWAREEAEQLVDLIRRQNWKNGGVLCVDRIDAIEYVAAKLRLIKQTGHGEGLNAASEAMDEVFKRPITTGVAS